MATKSTQRPATTGAAVVPGPLSTACDRFDAMVAALRKHRGLTAKGWLKHAPVTEKRLANWEKKSGFAVPPDHRAFLAERGPFRISWEFKRETAYGETIGAEVELLDLPERHKFAGDDSLPEFRDLWVFAQGERFRFSWRLRKGEPAAIVLESIQDDGSLHEVSGSFTEWLTRECEWFFASRNIPGFADKHVTVTASGLRSLPALEHYLFDRPPVDPTDPVSLVHAIRAAEHSSEMEKCAKGLLALRAIETAPAVAAFAQELIDDPREAYKGDVSEAVDLLGYVWQLDRSAGLTAARRIVADPPSGKDGIDCDVRPMALAIAHAFLLHGGEPAEKSAAKKALPGLLSEYLGGGSLPAFEALIGEAGEDAVIADALLARIDTLATPSYAFAIAAGFAKRRNGAGFERLAAVVARAAETDGERNVEWDILKWVLERPAKSLTIDIEADLDAARAAGTRWLKDAAARAVAGDVPELVPDEPIAVRVSTRPKIDMYAAPELVELLEVRDPKNPEAIGAFVTARELELYCDDDAFDTRVFAPLKKLERLLVNGLTPESKLEGLAVLPELRTLVAGGSSNGALTDAGVKALVGLLQRFVKLESLDLADNDLTGDGLDALATSPAVRALRELIVARDTSDEQHAALQKLLPGVRVLAGRPR